MIARRWPTCRPCGSSLAKRNEATATTTVRGRPVVREVWQCRCGGGRHILREPATEEVATTC